MQPKIKKIKSNYDGIVKSLLDSMNNGLLISFINSTFSTNYSSDASVIRLATETYDKELKQKRCDYFIKINDDFFLIEIQSNPDAEMEMRILEYSLRGAKLHGMTKNDDGTELHFPKPVVFYLRKNRRHRDKLSVKFTGSLAEKPFILSAKSIYIDDYSFSDMIDRSMFPMIPFYPLRYEKTMFRKHTKQDESAILSDLKECSEKLKKAYQDKLIEEEIYKYIRDWMLKVFHTVFLKSENRHTILDLKEAEKVMQYIVDEPMEGYDILATKREWERKAERKGEKRGKLEANTETAFNLLKNNISDDIILDCTGISAETLESLKKKLTGK